MAMSLLDIIKKKKSNECVKLQKTGKLYTIDFPEKETEHGIDECNILPQRKLKKFTNPDSFGTLDDLCQELEKFMNTERKVGEKRKLDKKKTNVKSRSFYITETCLCKCLERCINEKGFYSIQSLKYLIKKKLITSALHGLLVECFMKYDDIGLIQIISTCIRLKEYLVVKVLLNVMGKMESGTCEQIILNQDLNTCLVSTDILQRLLYIISMEIDFTILKEQFKLVVAKEAMTLLKILQYILNQVSNALEKDPDFALNVQNITEKKVLGWLDSLVSAHTMTFATSPLMKSSIQNLDTSTKKQIEYYRTIGELFPYLDVLQKSYELPSRRLELYSIEVITL